MRDIARPSPHLPLRNPTTSLRLALSSIGWDVLATDTSLVLSSVLTRNIDANRNALPISAGVIQTKELDWTVDPTEWKWTDRSAIATKNLDESEPAENLNSHLEPPFDLIVTADTIYSDELARPLLRCLHKLATLSTSESGSSPPVYVCVERRDPGLLDRTLEEAESAWGFTAERIRETKIKRAMKRGGVTWDKSDWEGVEIWKLQVSKPKQAKDRPSGVPHAVDPSSPS